MRSTLNCSAACSSGQCTIDPGLSTQDGIQLLQQLCRLQVDIAPEADDISPVLLGVMGILLSCGILLALFFLLFTIRFKNNRIVKMSSPNLNIVTIIGSILTYGSGYMFGLMEGRTVTAEISTKLIIQIRIWTLCIGTSLIFGPILGKSWRLYKVFTQRIPEKRVIIKDVQLLGLVAGVIGVDVLVLVTWGFADPLECTQSINAAIRAFEKDLSYSVTTIKWCSSHYTDIWIILISLLKGSLLLYGTYLAGLTSNVSSPPVNQTTAIMVGVYVVMFTAGIITPITRFLDSWPNLTYGVTTAGIFVCTSTINCLIFIPQVRQWKKFDEELNHVPNQMSKYLNSPSKTFRSMYSDEQIYHLLGENNSMKRLLTERNATIECLQEQVNNVKERLMYLMEPEYIDELRDDNPASQPSTACSPVINSALMCPNTTTGGPLEEEPLSDMLNNQDHRSGSHQDIQAVSLQSHLGQIGHDTKISPETVLHSQEGIEVFKDSGGFYRDSENYPNSETITGSFQKALDALEITLEIPSNLDNGVKIVQDPSGEVLTSSSARPAVATGADAKPSIGGPIKEMKNKFVNSEKLQEILQELNVNAVNTIYSPNKARRILPTGNLGQYSGTAEWVKHHCHNISPYMMRRRRPPFYSIRHVPPPYYILHSTHQHAKYINKESNRDTINALPTDHTQLQRTHRQLLPESSSLLRLPSVENIQMHLNAWLTPQKTEQRDGHAHSLTSGGDCIIKSHSNLKTDLPSKGIQIAGAEGSSEIYQYDYSDSESDSSDEMFCYYHRSYCEVCCEDSCNSSISETSDSEVYNAPFHWSQKHFYSHPTVNFKEDLKPTFV